MDSCRLGPVRPGRGEQRVGGGGGGGRRSWWSRRGSPWRRRWGRRCAGLLSGRLRIVQQAAKVIVMFLVICIIVKVYKKVQKYRSFRFYISSIISYINGLYCF